MQPKPSRLNKTPKQILLAIADELEACGHSHQEVEALLNEAKMLIWTELDTPEYHILKKEIDDQIAALSKYPWQKSQSKKNAIIKHVVADVQDSIRYHYKVNTQ